MIRQIPWILGWFMKTCFRSLETLVSVSAVCYNFICLAAEKIIQVWMWILFFARMEKTGGPGNWISVETSWCPLHFESSLGQSRGLRSSPGLARWLSAVWVLCSKALSPHRRSGYSCCSSPPRTSCSLTVAPCWATPGEEEVDWLRHNSQHNVWEEVETPRYCLHSQGPPATLSHHSHIRRRGRGRRRTDLSQFIFVIRVKSK